MRIPDDLRYSLRSLAKSPVFAAVSTISLACGIGANTGMFTVLDQVLFPKMPVRDPSALVQLKETGQHYGRDTGLMALSYPMYADIRSQNEVFADTFARFRTPVSVSFAGRCERGAAELVSGTYFPVLGLEPALGRFFIYGDDHTRGSAVAVLGYDYWQVRFGGDPNILGKQILLNDHRLDIVGVAPRGFDGTEAMFTTQIYVPIGMAPDVTNFERPLEDRRHRWVQVFARLKTGVTRSQAQASLAPLFHRTLEMEVRQSEFAHVSPNTRQQFLRMTLNVMPGSGGNNLARIFLEAPVLAMGAMAWLVLIIACANVANLMIARSVAREKEIVIRMAIGASHARIVRRLMIESLSRRFRNRPADA